MEDGDELRAGARVALPHRRGAGRARRTFARPARIPLFNLDVLKTLPSVDSGNVIDEAIQLSEELGLANSEEDLPPWDEMILRLQRCRPEWGWHEDLNPYALSTGAPLAELHRARHLQPRRAVRGNALALHLRPRDGAAQAGATR